MNTDDVAARDCMIASEPVLARDWDTTEEDKAWADVISRTAVIRELEALKALHEQNASASSDEQSKYAYSCYAAGTDHAIRNIKQLPAVREREPNER